MINTLNYRIFIASILSLLIGLFFSLVAPGQTKEKIDSATLKGKVVFLIVCNGNIKLTETIALVEKAQKEILKSDIVILDKSSKSNKDLIKKYELSNIQTPGILVIGSNGIEAKRFSLNQATPEKLVNAIPTPKQEEVLLAFSQNKSVFIVLSKTSMTDKIQVLDECEKSRVAMQNYAIIADIDLDDQSEQKFLKGLNVNFAATNTHVLVFNSKGKFIKEFEAPVISANLTNATLVDSDCPCSKSNSKEKRKKYRFHF